MRRECLTPGCGRAVHADIAHGYCYTCRARQTEGLPPRPGRSRKDRDNPGMFCECVGVPVDGLGECARCYRVARQRIEASLGL